MPTDFDAEYRFIDGKTPLDAANLNARMLSLHLRLNASEARGEGYDALIAEGLAFALLRIDEGVSPLLATLVAQIAEASTNLALLQAQVAGGIDATAIHFNPPAGGLASANVADALNELKAALVAGLVETARVASTMRARDLYLAGF